MATRRLRYEPVPVTDYLLEYKDKHALILKDVAAFPTHEERVARYTKLMADLETEFLARRRKDYEAIEFPGHAEKKCANASSDGKPNICKQCVSAPSSDLYVIKKKHSGSGSVSYPNNGGKACIKLKQSGRGSKWGAVDVMFGWRPASVAKRLPRDAAQLFKLIAVKPSRLETKQSPRKRRTSATRQKAS
jgi:hypothetical protein